MKLALCIAGHMRSFKETYPYLEQLLLKPYNPDIFLTSWQEDDPKIIEEALDLYKPVRYRIYDYSKYVGNFEETTTKVNSLKIKRLEVREVTRIFNDTEDVYPYEGYKKIGPESHKYPLGVPIISQFFQVQSCLQLMANFSANRNIQYDLVFKLRPDLLLFSDITLYASASFENFRTSFDADKNRINFDSMTDDRIYCVALNSINKTEYKTLNDYFYYGNQTAMTKLSSIHDEYYKTIKSMQDNKVPVALQGINESILYYYIKSKGMRVVTADINIPNNLFSLILRKDFSIT